MIKITRLDKSEIYINPHDIEFMESTPDTIITMLSGKKVIAREAADEIIARIIAYRARIVAESGNPTSAGTEH
ncbi:MAG: flagellar FlbD family protein [Spirochaetota bacterium]